MFETEHLAGGPEVVVSPAVSSLRESSRIDRTAMPCGCVHGGSHSFEILEKKGQINGRSLRGLASDRIMRPRPVEVYQYNENNRSMYGRSIYMADQLRGLVITQLWAYSCRARAQDGTRVWHSSRDPWRENTSACRAAASARVNLQKQVASRVKEMKCSRPP